ncbi:Mitochondrial outer membrane protein OM45 [Nakaseomyces bracarensis]|uniref:Mitochondrial outer membrane protein OM45 n=1 Tax=Nakaseomyces bracarensis TaxID=273131 RepID=A0ABR4NZ79_9SACH
MSKAVVTGAAAVSAAIVAITYNQSVTEKGKRTQTALSISRNGQMSSWTRIREGLWDDAVSLKDALLFRGIYNDNTQKYIERGRDDLAQQIVDSTSSAPPPQLERSTRPRRNVFSSMEEDNNDKGHNGDGVVDGKSIFHWGFNEIEKAKAVAIGEFDEVNKKYNELLDKFKQSKSSIFSSGDREIKKQVDQYKKLLEEKREALHKASEAFNNYTKETFNEISDKIDKQDVLNGAGHVKRKDLWNWMNEDNAGDNKKHDVEKVAAKSVVGWGERAQEFAEEEIAERERSLKPGPSEAQRRLDELKKYKENGWFTYNKDGASEEEIARRVIKGLEGWGDSAAQFAREEYEELKWNQAKSREQAAQAVDNALKKLDEAKAEVDETASKWWQFGKDKKDELHEKSLSKYEEAKKEYEDSKSALEKWTNKQQGKFWSMANDSVDSLQNQVDKAHDVVQDKLEDAKEYTKDKSR